MLRLIAHRCEGLKNLARSPSLVGIFHGFFPLNFRLNTSQLCHSLNKKLVPRGRASREMGQILKQPINRVWKDLNSAGACLRQEPVCQLQVYIVHHFFDCLAFQWPGHWFQSGSRLILNMILRMEHELLGHFQTRCNKNAIPQWRPNQAGHCHVTRSGFHKGRTGTFPLFKTWWLKWCGIGWVWWVLCGLG